MFPLLAVAAKLWPKNRVQGSVRGLAYKLYGVDPAYGKDQSVTCVWINTDGRGSVIGVEKQPRPDSIFLRDYTT